MSALTCKKTGIKGASLPNWLHNMQNEVLALRKQLDQYEKGLKGACLTCEPVGILNQKLEQQLAEANELLKKANNYGGCEFREINEYFEKYKD